MNGSMARLAKLAHVKHTAGNVTRTFRLFVVAGNGVCGGAVGKEGYSKIAEGGTVEKFHEDYFGGLAGHTGNGECIHFGLSGRIGNGLGNEGRKIDETTLEEASVAAGGSHFVAVAMGRIREPYKAGIKVRETSIM